ncbi:MAG: hypothetical protein WCF03_09180 [Nitrososphaeraceae archaeon]
MAVVEALRMNPDKYAIIYNSEYDDSDSVFDSSRGTNTAAAISPPYTSSTSTSTKPYQNNEYY